MYCENCGNYSGHYKLCKDCYDKLIEETYENESDCILCGHEAYGYSFCKECYYKYKDSVFSAIINPFGELEIINDETITKCIICKKDSNGYNFCPECYQKFKNKSIVLEITDCQNTKLLNSTYSGKTYVAEDGHRVKSKAEREIDNYFFNKGYKHAYEIELNINNDYGEKITLHPDFCLFKGKDKIYIEYWGYGENNTNYA